MKETVDYKYDQLFQQFGTEIIKVGRVYLSFLCVILNNQFFIFDLNSN